MTKLYNTEKILHNRLTTPDPIEAYIEEVYEHLAELPENAECIGDLVELFDGSPNPFIRCDEFGHIIYANRASGFAGSGRGKAEALPGFLLQPCLRAIETKSSQVCEAEFDFQKYQFVLVPFKNYTYVNIHGKALDKEKQAEIERLKAEVAEFEKQNRRLAEQLQQTRMQNNENESARYVENSFRKPAVAFFDLFSGKTTKNSLVHHFRQRIKDLTVEMVDTILNVTPIARKDFEKETLCSAIQL